MEEIISRLTTTLYIITIIGFFIVLANTIFKVSKMPGSIFKGKKNEKIIVIIIVLIMAISLFIK